MFEYIEAEESLISCLITRPDAIENVYNSLSPEMFESGILGRMYLEYRKGFENNKELTYIELKQAIASDYKDYEIDEAFANCVKRDALAFQIGGYASTIINHYKKTTAEKILERAELKDATVEEQLDRLINELNGLRNNEVSRTQTVSEITEEYHDKYFKDQDRPKTMLNIEDMDSMIGGFEGGDLVIIGARPAVGKSALVTQWAQKWAKDGLKVGFYNLEMTDKQIYERLVAAKSGIEITRLRLATRFLNDEQPRYEKAVEELKEQKNLYISTGGKKVADIRSDMRKMAYDIVIIDYLQLLVADERYHGNRAAEVGEISRQLKAIAIDFSIPVIALSQLNRASEGRENKEPSMGELREAGNLEQDASVIILMWNKDADDRSQKGCKVEKSRQGKTGRCDMRFDGAHVSFTPESQITPFD